MPTRGIYSDVTLPYLTLPSQQPNPFYLLQQVNNLLVYKFLSLQNTTLFLFLSELMDLFKLPSLFCDTFSLLQKRKNWRCSLLFWTSLLPTTVFQERNFGDTCKKLRLHNIWEVSSKSCTQDASTFLLMATKFPGRLRPTKAWNRLPSESPSVFPFYQWHWQILDRAERCCHCLGFSSGPSL